MIARDEETCVGLALDTCHKWIDRLCFIDNSSTDRTVEIVMERCRRYHIPLVMDYAPLTDTIGQLRLKCIKLALPYNPEWFFVVDADMVYNHEKINAREIAQKKLYDAHFFRTLNLYGDRDSGLIGGMNIPHMWLFRNKNGIHAGPNYTVPNTWNLNPDTERFIGWNLTGMKDADHFFWRSQVWYSRAYNYQHNTNLSPTEFIKLYFGPNGMPPNYKESFVYYALITNCRPVSEIAALKSINLTEEEFREKYLDYPKEYREWRCPFKLIFENGSITGRFPDLMDFKLIPYAEIYQYKPKVSATFKEWFGEGRKEPHYLIK